MRWGLLPYWSKEPKAQYASFNARAEAIESQPMFRIPFQQRHCLIPAHGWLEWPVSERRKQRWRFSLPDRSDFAFAGLWDHWERAGQVIESCTIIVCDAAETIRHVHDRMPVILKPADYDFWLHGGVAERRPLKALLVPYAGQLTPGPVGR
jgi:putative SOS response-associated peptidase YedK